MPGVLIDFESTGLDTSKDRIIEIGALLVTDKWEPLGSLSVLVKHQITPEISKITGITQAELDSEGLPIEEAFTLLAQIIGKDVQWAIAYNREFDEKLFKSELARTAMGMVPELNNLAQVPWLCAMVDIESNYDKKCWKMSHLALDYGITVDPKKLHRALNDVELMTEILRTTNQTPQSMETFQRVPWIYVRAIIPAPWEDGGKGRDEAKRLGFSWEKAKGDDRVFEKAWVKRIKAHKLQEEIQTATIKVREIQGA